MLHEGRSIKISKSVRFGTHPIFKVDKKRARAGVGVLGSHVSTQQWNINHRLVKDS